MRWLAQGHTISKRLSWTQPGQQGIGLSALNHSARIGRPDPRKVTGIGSPKARVHFRWAGGEWMRDAVHFPTFPPGRCSFWVQGLSEHGG